MIYIPALSRSCMHEKKRFLLGGARGVGTRLLENKQTAKMAEGQDRGQTSAKCELVSALPVMYAQENVLGALVPTTVSLRDVIWSFLHQQFQTRPL